MYLQVTNLEYRYLLDSEVITKCFNDNQGEITYSMQILSQKLFQGKLQMHLYREHYQRMLLP